LTRGRGSCFIEVVKGPFRGSRGDKLAFLGLLWIVVNFFGIHRLTFVRPFQTYANKRETNYSRDQFLWFTIYNRRGTGQF